MRADPVPGLVSVVIPSFNGEAHLAETLRSVIAEHFTRLEIIVVDDGSSDNSAAVARGFGNAVQVIEAPHRGLAATRNTGIRAARGAFILNLDHDDLLVAGSLGLRLKHFADDPALDMVTGKVMNFLSPDIPEGQRARYAVPAEPQQGHLSGAALIRAATFHKFGLLNEQFGVNADLDWSVRVQDEGARICYIDDIVVRRRIHGKNLTIVYKNQLDSSRIRILRASLARRRKAHIQSGAAD